MKKKQLLTAGLAACLAVSMAIPAYAANTDANVNADGTEVTAPGNPDYNQNGGGNTQENGMSYNEATVSSNNGVDFTTVNDDDTLAGDADTNGADINVWAKVVDSGSKVYKVDLAWGAMKFEFNSGAGQWNTTSHTYDGGGGTAEWTVSYIDGVNNKVEVTNHSNNAIDAGFSYTMEGTPFNETATGDNAVVGHFFKENDKALAGAGVLTGTYSTGTETAAVTDQLTDNKISLATADKYNSTAGDGDATDAANDQPAGARTDAVYFAFSGTPDEGRGATLDTFRKVGVITVTVAPNKDVPLNRPVYAAP